MGTLVFDKVKTIAAGVSGELYPPPPPGGPGQCLSEGAGVKPLNNFGFFFHIKHAKIVIVKVNIG